MEKNRGEKSSQDKMEEMRRRVQLRKFVKQSVQREGRKTERSDGGRRKEQRGPKREGSQ